MRGASLAMILLMFLVAAFLWLAWDFWFVCDDAYISFRYARNWADGLGVRYNLRDEVPVEGYSNFLWVAIAAVVEAVGGRPDRVMPALSMATGATWLVYLWRTTQDRFGWSPWVALVATLTLAASPGFVIWATSGLETLPAAFLLYVLFDRWVLAHPEEDGGWGAMAAIGLALIRTEGIGWVGVIAVMASFLRWREGAGRPGWRGLGLGLAAFVMVYAAYFAWRYTTYQSLVSNIAHAKVDFGPERVQRGLDYVLGYWSEAIAPPVQMLGLLAAWSVAGWRGLLTAAMALGVVLYALLVGGDFMTMGRLLVPGLAFTAVLVGFAVERAGRWGRPARSAMVAVALGLVALGSLPLADVQLMPREVRKGFRVRWNTSQFRSELGQWRFMATNAERWTRLGLALDQVAPPHASLVLGAIGAVGYHTDLHIFDRYGLVSREVAMREGATKGRVSPGHDKVVDVSFFFQDEPTYLDADLVAGRSGLRKVPATVRPWRSRVERLGYGPGVYPVELDGERKYLVVIERVADARAAWEGVEARVDELMSGASEE